MSITFPGMQTGALPRGVPVSAVRNGVEVDLAEPVAKPLGRERHASVHPLVALRLIGRPSPFDKRDLVPLCGRGGRPHAGAPVLPVPGHVLPDSTDGRLQRPAALRSLKGAASIIRRRRPVSGTLCTMFMSILISVGIHVQFCSWTSPCDESVPSAAVRRFD